MPTNNKQSFFIMEKNNCYNFKLMRNYYIKQWTLEQPYYVTTIWSSKLCRPRSFIQRYEMTDPAFVRRCLVIFRIVWTTYHKRHPEEIQVFAHVRPLMSQYAISHLPEEATWSSTRGPNLSELLHSMNLSYTLHVHGFLLVYCQIYCRTLQTRQMTIVDGEPPVTHILSGFAK